MKLKNKKHRITNEPAASPLVRLEKKYNSIANAAVAYLQVKEKKNRMIPRVPPAYSKVELKNKFQQRRFMQPHLQQRCSKKN
jgi:hypothetical protein